MVRYSTGKKSQELNIGTVPDGTFINSAKEFMEIMDREVRDELDHFTMFGESIETKRQRETAEARISVSELSNTQYWQERYSGDSPKGMRTENNPVGQQLLHLLAENALQLEQIDQLMNQVRARDCSTNGSRKSSDQELFGWMISLRETRLNKKCSTASTSGETKESDSSITCATEYREQMARSKEHIMKEIIHEKWGANPSIREITNETYPEPETIQEARDTQREIRKPTSL